MFEHLRTRNSHARGFDLSSHLRIFLRPPTSPPLSPYSLTIAYNHLTIIITICL